MRYFRYLELETNAMFALLYWVGGFEPMTHPWAKQEENHLGHCPLFPLLETFLE
jgi:hypothetical protein